MAIKTAPPPPTLPEQVAVEQATDHLTRCDATQREAIATLGRIRDIISPPPEHTTAQPIEFAIRPERPGSSAGVMAPIAFAPHKTYPTPTPTEYLRARQERPGAELRVLEATVAVEEARKTLEAARTALELRHTVDALAPLERALTPLLADIDTLATRAEAFTRDHIDPVLVRGGMFALPLQDCRLHELAQLRERAPTLRALLAALRDQYTTPNGGS